MNKNKGFSKLWFPVLLFVAFVAGCASNSPEFPIIPSTTTPVMDTTRPVVSFTSPANGAVDVPFNRKVSVAFSETMNPLTLTNATFTLTSPGLIPVPGAVVPAGSSATFIPASDLAASTTYTATITTGAKDPAGNALAANFVWTFTTGLVADTIAPTVSVTSPTDTAVSVPVNRKVTVGFSEAMDPLTITTASFTLKETLSGNNVPGAVFPVGTSATFIPASNFAFNTNYTATIKGGAVGGVKDLAGNPMITNFVFTFTTSGTVDVTRPRVTATNNANGAINVPVNNQVGATFSEVMDPITISATTFTLKQGATIVPGIVTYSGLNTVFVPTTNLLNNTLYTATITTGATDLAGNALAGNQAPLPAASNYVWSWTTGAAPDIIKPTVILVNPADLAINVPLNTTVNATFSEAMDPLTINTSTFTVAGVTGLVTYDALTKIATFSPAGNLAASTTYTATVSTGVKDLAGNTMALDKIWTFTTGTGLAPGAVALGSAGTFGIMATAAITNTGLSIINGDVSLDPGTSMTGFPPGVVNGSIHINDTVSAQARADLLVAYNFAKSLPPGTTISAGADLGALYPTGIPPGTYTSGSTMLVSTPLVLDAGGNANAVWVFQLGSSLTTTASVSLANGAQAKNVFWVPTSDATIGVGTIFYGTIISGRDVTAITGAVINGRILAGAITAGTIALQTSTVNVPAP